MVRDFLEAQGVAPFFHARDRYVAVVYRLLDDLAQDIENHEEAFNVTTETFGDDVSIHQALGEWLEMDCVITRHCQVHHLNEPHPALSQAPGEQTVVGERAAFFHLRSIHVQHMLRLARDVG